MHIITVVMEAVSGREAMLEEALRKHSAASQTEDGCIRFDVARGNERANCFFLFEAYKDKAAFDAHTQSAHFANFREVSKDLVALRTIEHWTSVTD